MLLIALYFVFIVLLAAAAVWVYRNLPWRRGFKEHLIGRVETYPKMTLRAQQGFISLETRKRKNRQVYRRPRTRLAEIRAPWGW